MQKRLDHSSLSNTFQFIMMVTTFILCNGTSDRTYRKKQANVCSAPYRLRFQSFCISLIQYDCWSFTRDINAPATRRPRPVLFECEKHKVIRLMFPNLSYTRFQFIYLSAYIASKMLEKPVIRAGGESSVL